MEFKSILNKKIRLNCMNVIFQAGLVHIFDRVLSEVVVKMRDMKVDKAELGCLKSIILFNPGNVKEG